MEESAQVKIAIDIETTKAENAIEIAPDSSEVKPIQTANQESNYFSLTSPQIQTQNNAQTQLQTQQTNTQSQPPQHFPSLNAQTPNPTNIYSIQTVQKDNSPSKIPLIPNPQTQSNISQPQIKQQECQTSPQIKTFSIQLSQYSITFELTNSHLMIKAQNQTERQCHKSSFFYPDFTQKMKALFESTEEMWSILESAQDCLFFQNSQLYFKILLGEVEKLIHIPLSQHHCSDHEYIDKLQRMASKYKNLSKKLTSDLEKQASQCSCIKIKKETPAENKSVNSRAKEKIKIDRKWLSRASSVWPDPPIDFVQKQEKETRQNNWAEINPVLEFEELMEKLSKKREEFNLLREEIEEKVLSGGGVKILKLKLMGLEKKRKDWFYELDLEKMKFANLKCRNDIYNEIDQFLNDIRLGYAQIQATVNLIRDDK